MSDFRDMNQSKFELIGIRSSLLSAVMTTSLDAVVVIDHYGIVIGWNKVAELIFGYTAAESIGRQVAELIIPNKTRAAHFHSMDRFVNFGETHILGKRVKMSALHKNGYEFPVELAIMTSSDLGTKCFVGFIRDLTKESEASAKIEKLTGEILQISRLNAMGIAASTIAHELNQPLAAAANYLAGCKRIAANIHSTDTVDMKFGIAGAQDAICRAAEVVKSVREIVANRPRERTRQSLEELIDASLRLIGGNPPVQPLICIEDDATFVLVNKGQIAQVILNLIKNAVEATHGLSNPLICCFAKKKGEVVEICIRDNGVGLSVETYDDLFEPFRTTKSEGLGIGLSICRSIIEDHNGRLWAESEESGTSFYFTVPSV